MIGARTGDRTVKRMITPNMALALYLVWSLAAPPSSSGQKRPTLREKAREQGQLRMVGYGEPPRGLATLGAMVENSDFIIRGQVVDEKTRLSQNEYVVVTDYAIEVLEVLKDPTGMIKPGEQFIVSKWGGNVIVEGHPISEETPLFPPIPWLVEHLFFISRAKNPEWLGPYHFTGYGLGVIRIDGEVAICPPCEKIRHPFAKEIEGKRTQELLSTVKEKAKSLTSGRDTH